MGKEGGPMSDAVLRQLLASGHTQDAYRHVVNELEQLIWQFILWPSAARASQQTPRLLEIAAIVEILPNVYIHSTQLKGEGNAVDHFLRVWGSIRHPDGSVTNRDLLVSRSDTYPDQEIVAMREGMDRNLAWYDEIESHLSRTLTRRTQEQLAKIAQIDGVAALLPPPDDPETNKMQQLLAQGEIAELLLLITQRLAGAFTAPGSSARSSSSSPGAFGFADPSLFTNFSGFGAAPSSSRPFATSESGRTDNPGVTPLEARVLVDMRQQAEVLFTDWHHKREEAYKRRDELARELRQLYFSLYPYMEQAARHTAIDLEQALAAWIREGCPAPVDEVLPALPPGISADKVAWEDPEQRAQRIQAAVEKARLLAEEFERRKAQISELSAILERLCELVGGHASNVERDTTGAAVIRCLRCGVRMDARPPEKSDSWVH
jgi:hypothetical protein